MSKIRKMVLWSRFPFAIREMRKAVFMKHGIKEERYPVEMRRILYLANRETLARWLAR